MLKFLTHLTLALTMALPMQAFGKLQNEDFKSLAELTTAGGTAAQLLNDTKVYVTANGINQQLSAAITSGLIGGSGGGGINILNNPDFEQGGVTTSWGVSAGTAAAVTTGTNLLLGSTTASFLASASAQAFQSTSTAVPQALQGSNCMAQVYYKYSGTAGDYTFQVDNGSGTPLSVVFSLPQSTTASLITLPSFACGTGNVRARILSTVSSPGTIYLDHFYIGEIKFTSSKGQSSATTNIAQQIQAPNSSVTQVGNSTSLIETGYQNLLANPSFEHSIPLTGWTVTNGTPTVSTSSYMDGAQAESISLSAVTGAIIEQSVTPGSALQGVNTLYGMWVKTTVTTLQVCAVQGSTEVSCISAVSDGLWHFNQILFPGPSSGSIGVRLKAVSSSTGTVVVDQSYVGIAGAGILTVSAMTDWKSYSLVVGGSTTAPTFGGTVVTNQAIWRRVGDTMEISYNFQQSTGGTAGSGLYLYPIPSGFSIDTTKATLATTQGTASVINSGGSLLGPAYIATTTANNTNYAQSGSGVSAYNSTNLAITITNGATFSYPFGSSTVGTGYTNTTLYVSFNAKIPIQGWTSNIAAVPADQTNYGATAYTPTFVGVAGAIASANDCTHKRDGQYIFIDCKFTASSASATTMSMSLPAGVTIDSTLVPNLRLTLGRCGRDVTSGSQNATVLITGGTSLVNFGLEAGSSSPLVAQTGSTIGNGVISCSFRAGPISGWAENGKAPTLIGSVLSGTLGSERIERGTFYTTAYGTSCSASTCGSTSSLPGVTVTRSGTGLYAVNFPAGSFSGPPSCSFTVNNNSSVVIAMVKTSGAYPTSTVYGFNVYGTSAGALQDAYGDFVCMGPR